MATVKQAKTSKGAGRWLSVLLDPTILILAAVFTILVAALLFQQSRQQTQLMKFTALQEAARYSQALAEFRTLYASEVVQTARAQHLEVTDDYDVGEKKGKAIPLPITLSKKLGNALAGKQGGGKIDLYSPYPFLNRSEANWDKRDQFAKDAWEALAKNPRPSYFSRFESQDGREWLRYATADVMRQACVDCHNTHADSPKKDWQEGDVRGILEVRLPLDSTVIETQTYLRESLWFSFLIGGLGLAGLVIPLVRLRRGAADLERKVRERTTQLRDSEALYASTVQSLPLCVLRKDLSERFTFANQAACKMLGRTLDEIVGKTDFDFFPAPLAEKYRRDDQHIIATGEMFQDVEGHQTGTGQTIYVEVMKTPLYDADGRTIGVQATFWDVTTRKKIEDALRQSQQRFQQLANNIVEVFWITSADGREMVFVSPAYEQIWGRTCQSLYENPLQWLEAIHPKDRTRVEKAFVRAAQEGMDQTYRIVRPDGSIRWVRDRGFPVRDVKGDVYRIAGTAQDVTRQKRAENALRKAKEQAESASRAKDAFLANVSHEIRTPMNAIVGMTDLVLKTPLNAQQRVRLQTVLTSADALLTVINAILDFSKIEAGKFTLERARFELGECVGDALKTIATQAHDKGLELTFGIRPDIPPWIVGDPARLRQVLLNLVGNAIKFTQHGEVVVTVECTQRSSDTAILHFAVTDTGIGIPPDKLDAIFRPFEQADMSTTRQYGGTGLGLTISSRLVEMMGGRMWVDSTPGRGSTFHFQVSFEVADGQATRKIAAGRTSLRGLRVLVVDDNGTNREILREMLSSWEMRPAVAANADDALGLLQRAYNDHEPFALLLTDAQMPGKDGFVFVESALKTEFLGAGVIMMLTSGERPGDLARCQELGVAAHLFKPIKPSELLDAIGRVFGTYLPDREQTAAAAIPQLPPLDVLVVEDSPVNQQLAIGLLEMHGHSVTVANDGREAVNKLEVPSEKYPPFDLVLMDVQMPEVDGLMATSQIRQWERALGRRVPIIAMTAHAMKEDRQLCLDAGMDGYVAKPIRAIELFGVIAEVLKGTSTSSPLNTGEAAKRSLSPLDKAAAGDNAAQSPASSTMSPSAVPPNSTIDWQAAMQAAAGDPQLLRIVLDAFLGEAPRRLEEIRTGIGSQDAGLLRRAAHTLKSSLRLLGCKDAYEVALKMEEHGRDGQFGQCQSLLDELAPQVEQVLAETKEYLERPAT